MSADARRAMTSRQKTCTFWAALFGIPVLLLSLVLVLLSDSRPLAMFGAGLATYATTNLGVMLGDRVENALERDEAR